MHFKNRVCYQFNVIFMLNIWVSVHQNHIGGFEVKALNYIRSTLIHHNVGERPLHAQTRGQH